MEEIEVVERKRMNIQDAYVIDGFPSVGLVGSISANYLVSFLGLEEIAIMDSVHFPSVSLVRGGRPQAPVRIYWGQKGDDKIVVLVSEFPPPAELMKPLAKTIMDWFEENRCRLIISPEGLVIGEAEAGAGRGIPKEAVVFGIGSTASAVSVLKGNDIPVFENGVIVGLAGVLLNEGVNRNDDVIVLLSEAHAEYPDARAAAAVTAAIDRILLGIEVDITPLLAEAAKIEDKLKDIYKKAGKKDELTKMRSVMYG